MKRSGRSGMLRAGAIAAALWLGVAPATPARAADELLAALTARFPAPDSSGVCADASLRLAFRTPPVVGRSGQIRVFRSAQPNQPVASVRVDATEFSDTIG